MGKRALNEEHRKCQNALSNLSWLTSDLAQVIMERAYKKGVIPLEEIDTTEIAKHVKKLLKGSVGELEVAKLLIENDWRVLRLKPYIMPEEYENFPDLLIFKYPFAIAFVEAKNLFLAESRAIEKLPFFSENQMVKQYNLARLCGIPLILAFKERSSRDWRFSRIYALSWDYPRTRVILTPTKEAEVSKQPLSSSARFAVSKLESEVVFGRVNELNAKLLLLSRQMQPDELVSFYQKLAETTLLGLILAIYRSSKKKTDLNEFSNFLQRCHERPKEYLKEFIRSIHSEL